MAYKLGDLLELDGLPCVVVGLCGAIIDGAEVPEEHIVVWFGDPKAKRKSEGGAGSIRPEVWIIPDDCFDEGQEPIMRH